MACRAGTHSTSLLDLVPPKGFGHEPSHESGEQELWSALSPAGELQRVMQPMVGPECESHIDKPDKINIRTTMES